MSDLGSEYGRLLAQRDRLIASGVDPSELLVPERVPNMTEQDTNATPTYPREGEAQPAPGYSDLPPVEEGTTGETEAPPVEPEGETFDSPTSNDVGEQTKTQADEADEEADEGTDEVEAS